MRWFGTVRARTGIVVDNVLLYATGGLAYARFNSDLTVFEDAPATSAAFSPQPHALGLDRRCGHGMGVRTQLEPEERVPLHALPAGRPDLYRHDR